jgi:riboflavin synthase
MFTGIVQCIAEIRSIQRRDGLLEMSLSVPLDISESRVGDSFCVQGACLTAVSLSRNLVKVDVSMETLRRTTVGNFSQGQRVNLERALRLCDPVGGHLVTGHVDGTGRLLHIEKTGMNADLVFQADNHAAVYLVEKGSICIDGVSLTLGVCQKETFRVHIIPHTMNHTTLQWLRIGDRVNLEADIIGKYVEKFLENRGLIPSEKGLSKDLLEKHGFSSS